MTDKTDHEVVKRLEALLEEERAALLEGDLKRVSGFLDEKQDLIERLNAEHSGDAKDLQVLQVNVERNQDLLDSALQGIRKVSARIATFRNIRRSLETYDEQGRKCIIEGEISRRVEKRA